MSNDDLFEFNKFMDDLEKKKSHKFIEKQDPNMLDEYEMKRLRMIRERELWQNRIRWSN